MNVGHDDASSSTTTAIAAAHKELVHQIREREQVYKDCLTELRKWIIDMNEIAKAEGIFCNAVKHGMNVDGSANSDMIKNVFVEWSRCCEEMSRITHTTATNAKSNVYANIKWILHALTNAPHNQTLKRIEAIGKEIAKVETRLSSTANDQNRSSSNMCADRNRLLNQQMVLEEKCATEMTLLLDVLRSLAEPSFVAFLSIQKGLWHRINSTATARNTNIENLTSFSSESYNGQLQAHFEMIQSLSIVAD